MRCVRSFAFVCSLVLTLFGSASAQLRPKIAVMETAFNKRGDVTSIRDAKRAGYHAIQMHSGMPDGFRKMPIDQSLGLEIATNPAVLKAWKTEAEAAGVKIISLCAGSLNRCQIWGRDRQLAMRIAKQTIAGCKTLGAPVMLFPFFGPSNFQTDDEAFRGVAGFMRELLPYAREHQVVIGIEAPVTTDRVIELLESLSFPEHLKIYYDTGNLFHKEDIYQTIRKYGKEHFCEIHIKAAEHSIAGEGRIDLGALAKALDASQYDKWLVYEANRNGREPLANRLAIEDLVSKRRSLFSRDNLVAWCIVPFDASQRGPEQRAMMLKRLGFQRVAYDWRKEHVATFEEEIVQYREHELEFFAFWDWHESIGPLIEKHGIKPQIWKTCPSPTADTHQNKVIAAVRQLMPLVDQTRRLGLQLGLYNHGGWGGEPANLIAICDELRATHSANHVGIVYNLHHAHGQMQHFAENLRMMRPYLLCLNINGMAQPASLASNPGRKILPVGKGYQDAQIIRLIANSGYRGPIGVLDHRSNMDAAESLQQNVEGLSNVVKSLNLSK